MKKVTVLALCIVLTILAAPPVPAAQMAGVTMPDSMTIGGQTVPLAGMGMRNKFVVKVYVAGLYLAAPDLDQDTIILSEEAKAVRMKFLYRKVEAGKLQNAWREGFEKNSPNASADLQKRMEEFTKMFHEDALKGDEYLFVYHPGEGMEIILKGTKVGVIEGSDFAAALMAIWFGEYPADKGLKKSVLKGLK